MTKSPSVTIRIASQVGHRSRESGGDRREKEAEARRERSRGAGREPDPSPSDAAFFLSSSVASSSSSLTSELGVLGDFLCGRRGSFSLSRAAGVGIAPPVDDLRDQDPGDDSRTDDQQRARPFLLPTRFRRAAGLRAGRRDGASGAFGRLLVLRSIPFGPRCDQARLQLAEERGVVGELGRDLRSHASLGGRLVREFLEPRLPCRRRGRPSRRPCRSSWSWSLLRRGLFAGGDPPDPRGRVPGRQSSRRRPARRRDPSR